MGHPGLGAACGVLGGVPERVLEPTSAGGFCGRSWFFAQIAIEFKWNDPDA